MKAYFKTIIKEFNELEIEARVLITLMTIYLIVFLSFIFYRISTSTIPENHCQRQEHFFKKPTCKGGLND